MRLDDELFVNRCLEGDQAAFTCLVSKYKEMVHAYAYYKVGDYQEAQDIAQEVFIKAYSKLGQLKWPHRFQSWLYSIVANECRMWLRKRSKEREQEVPLEDVPAGELSGIAMRPHDDEDMEETVIVAMESLPVDNQLALSLYYMSNLSIKEIAYFLGTSPGNVKVKLHRARRQLGERMEKMIGKQLRKEKLRSGFVFKVVDSIRDMPIPSLPKPRPIKWAPIPISIGIALLIGVIGYGVSSGRDVSQDMPGLKPAETTYEVSLLLDLDEQAALDIKTVGNELVALNSGDDIAAEAGRSPNIGITVRRVAVMDAWGAPSPDGRYLSFTDWASGNLAVRDLTTGEYRNLTSEGTWGGPDQWAEFSTWSPDSKQVAYAWWNEDRYQLRIVGLDGSEPRVLYPDENKELHWFQPHAWSRDGKSILAMFSKKTGPYEAVLVSVADGSARVLKSGYFWANKMSLAPDGRCVVYDRGGNGKRHDIFLLATDGSGETRRVEHPADDCGPVWSPDGKSIVFVSDRSGAYDAWLMHMTDGKPVGEPALVRRNIGEVFPMGFTRSGSLYYCLDAGGQDVYVATVDPGTGKLLSSPTKAIQRFEGFNRLPAWSPDGKYLAYVSKRPRAVGAIRDWALVIRSMETGQERELHAEVEEARGLKWSPDGRSILIGLEKGFNLIDVQTGDETPITREPVAKSAWSPDGKTVFYIRYIPRRVESEGPSYGIMAHDLETGREQELRRDIGGPRGLAISPGGRQLAFFYIRRRVDSGEWYYSIVAHDLETGREQELRRDICHPHELGIIGVGPDLGISPDGRQLTFSPGDFNTGERLLKVMPAAGGEPRELLRLKDPERYCGSRWMPDGRYILFGTRKRSPDNPDEPVELWRIPAAGGEPQKLLAMDGLLNLSIHPDGQRIVFTGGKKESEVWVMENFLPGFTADK